MLIEYSLDFKDRHHIMKRIQSRVNYGKERAIWSIRKFVAETKLLFLVLSSLRRRFF